MSVVAAVERELSRFSSILSREAIEASGDVTRVRVLERRAGEAMATAVVAIDAGREVTLRLARTRDGESFMRTGAWAWSHEAGPDEGSRTAIEGWCRALRERMTAERATALDAGLSQLLARLPEVPSHDEGEPVGRDDAERLFGSEGALIAPLAEHYARHYGAPIRATAVGSARFPDVAPEQSLFMRAPPSFTEDALFRAYLWDLGYGIDDGGFMRVVPTPARFEEARGRLGLGASGYAARLFRARVAVLSPRRWLSHLAHGVFPINLYGRAVYRATAPARWIGARLHPALRTMWHTHFHALGHDMTLHVFAMHRIPPDEVERLKDLARQILRDERSPRRIARRASFFEGTLTRFCVGLWTGMRHPDEFAPAFRAGISALR